MPGAAHAPPRRPRALATQAPVISRPQPGIGHRVLHHGSLHFELTRQDLVNHTFKRLVKFTAKTHTTYVSTTKKVKSSLGRVNYTKYAYGLGVCADGDTFSDVHHALRSSGVLPSAEHRLPVPG